MVLGVFYRFAREVSRSTVFAALTAIAACSGGPLDTNPTDAVLLDRQFPIDYKAQIVLAVKAHVKDPYSIRSAEISAPRATNVNLSDAVYVCAKFNTKNSFGAYIGLRSYLFYFQNKKIIGSPIEGEYVCDNNAVVLAAYVPFPEIENIK